MPNQAATVSALAGCDTAWQAQTGSVDNQRGKSWFHGSMALTLFNTIAAPNSSKWTYCARRDLGLGSDVLRGG